MELTRIRSHLMVLYACAFLSQTCLGVISLATPILAYVLEASPLLVGFIGASSGATYAIMARVFGSASDRFSRKKLLFTGGIVQALSAALCFISPNPYQLAFARFVLSFGAALFWPLTTAHIGDLVGIEQLGQALMGFNVSWSLGTIVGPQLGGLLITWFSIRTPFLVALGVFFFIAMLLLLGTEANINRSYPKPHLNENENFVQNDSKAIPLLYTFLSAFASGTLSALFPFYATDLGVSADLIGFMFLLSGLTQTITVLLADTLQFKLGEGKMLLLSPFFLFCSLIMISLTSMIPILFVGFAIFGLGFGIAYSTALFRLMKGSGSRKGKTAGIFESTLGIGFFAGPFVGGALYQVGDTYPYFFCAFVSLSIMTFQLSMMLRRVRAN